MRGRLLALGVAGGGAAGLAVVGRSDRGPDVPPTRTPAAAHTETTDDPIAWRPNRRREPRTRPAGAGNTETTVGPIAWSPKRRRELERRAAAGLAHVIYAKSPGGAIGSAARTATWRPQIERAAKRGGVDPDVLEAIVLLE